MSNWDGHQDAETERTEIIEQAKEEADVIETPLHPQDRQTRSLAESAILVAIGASIATALAVMFIVIISARFDAERDKLQSRIEQLRNELQRVDGNVDELDQRSATTRSRTESLNARENPPVTVPPPRIVIVPGGSDDDPGSAPNPRQPPPTTEPPESPPPEPEPEPRPEPEPESGPICNLTGLTCRTETARK